MINNEGRRAVAKMLKDGTITPLSTKSFRAMLADLIEPETCRLVPFETPGHMPNGVRCTNCGKTFTFGYGDWNFCPTCGAEVIR